MICAKEKAYQAETRDGRRDLLDLCIPLMTEHSGSIDV